MFEILRGHARLAYMPALEPSAKPVGLNFHFAITLDANHDGTPAASQVHAGQSVSQRMTWEGLTVNTNNGPLACGAMCQ